MGTAVNELSVKLDEVVEYIAYLAARETSKPILTINNSIEPAVSEGSKDFAIAFHNDFKCGFGAVYLIARIGRTQDYQDKNDTVNKIFSNYSEHLYSLWSDIAKRECRSDYFVFINAMLIDIPDRKYFREISPHYNHIKATEGSLKLQHIIDLVEGKITNDIGLILAIKVELIAKLDNIINKAFYDMHGFQYHEILEVDE